MIVAVVEIVGSASFALVRFTDLPSTEFPLHLVETDQTSRAAGKSDPPAAA